MQNTPFWAWAGFAALIFALLALDLFVFHRRAHVVRFKEALFFSAFWIATALVFNIAVWLFFGKAQGLEFLTAYLVEKSLSVDNIFVFLLIFSAFNVSEKYRHRVLFWGIFGALVMRGIFIGFGIAALNLFHWLVYPFGLILITAGIKMIAWKKQAVVPEKNLIIRFAKKLLPVADRFDGQHFFVNIDSRIAATPLFMALLAIESADIIFAVDSVPAVLAITRDPFIAYTSIAFGILGLRALYFAVAGAIEKLRFLHIGLAAILVFIGIKMMLGKFIYIAPLASLGVILGLLILATLASCLKKEDT